MASQAGESAGRWRGPARNATRGHTLRAKWNFAPKCVPKRSLGTRKWVGKVDGVAPSRYAKPTRESATLTSWAFGLSCDHLLLGGEQRPHEMIETVVRGQDGVGLRDVGSILSEGWLPFCGGKQIGDDPMGR